MSEQGVSLTDFKPCNVTEEHIKDIYEKFKRNKGGVHKYTLKGFKVNL
jgi:hypothetical protein